jgi:hypothetical protein
VLAGERERGGAADAASRTGHERNLAREAWVLGARIHHLLLFV